MANNININGQNISMEDIQAALQSQGIDIRELAKQAKALQRGEIVNPEKKSVVSTLEFKLALVNYPDFCIERTTAKTRQLIVIMPSCKGYYVKSYKGNQEFVEELTPEIYSKLSAGMQDLNLPNDFWIKTVKPGKVFAQELLKALKSDTYIEMIKYRIVPKYEEVVRNSSYIENNEYIKAYKANPILFREFFNSNKPRYLLLKASMFVQHITEDFGLNNVRDFLQQLELSLVSVTGQYERCTFGNTYGRSKIYPDIEMEYRTFRDYVLYQSVFMGYGMTMDGFFREWKDSIQMQRNLYGKIKEKYHDNLPLYHSQLSYRQICMKEYIDERKMKEMVEFAALYQGTSGKYVFISPTCRQDFLDEAQMQQNCLASYVSKFVNGDCVIMFMREKEDPTQSVVTIEICKDDDGKYTRINQKYQARNRPCTEEQEDAIAKWVKRAINRVNQKLKGEEVEVDEELTDILKTIEQQ